RLRAVLVRLAYGTGMVTAFAIGSIGLFLALDWPPLLREIVLGYLLAFLVLRFGLIATRFVLAPGGERFRILPMSTEAARFWHRRIGIGLGWFVFWFVTLNLLGSLGLAPASLRLTTAVLAFGLVAIILDTVWRRPRPATQRAERQHHATEWLITGFVMLLWLLRLLNAMPGYWLGLVPGGVPAAIGATRRAVDHLLRPPGTDEVIGELPSIAAASVARGLRGLLIIGGMLLLAWAWSLDLTELTSGDAVATRLLRGTLHAII